MGRGKYAVCIPEMAAFPSESAVLRSVSVVCRAGGGHVQRGACMRRGRACAGRGRTCTERGRAQPARGRIGGLHALRASTRGRRCISPPGHLPARNGPEARPRDDGDMEPVREEFRRALGTRTRGLPETQQSKTKTQTRHEKTTLLPAQCGRPARLVRQLCAATEHPRSQPRPRPRCRGGERGGRALPRIRDRRGLTAVRDFGPACTAALDVLFDEESADPYVLPLFTAPPLPPANPSLPAVVPVRPGALQRIFAYVQVIKASPAARMPSPSNSASSAWRPRRRRRQAARNSR